VSSLRGIRLGAIGAARITPSALLDPARFVPSVQISAIASRSIERATAMAQRYGVNKVHKSYQDLLADPNIDAVYIALPNAYHAEFIIQALQEGKHVLCEKPLTSNCAEARYLQAAITENPKQVVMDAYHWRYHPIADDILNSLPRLGRIRSIQTSCAFPLLRPRDIRWELALAGGAMMDVGCYPLSFLTLVSDANPRVLTASALTYKKQIDRRTDVALLSVDGVNISMTASMLSRRLMCRRARIEGTDGVMQIRNPFAAHRHGYISLTTAGVTDTITYPSRPTTYQYQLQAFAAAINGDGANRTPVQESLRIMTLVDEIYAAADLYPRPSRLGLQDEHTRSAA